MRRRPYYVVGALEIFSMIWYDDELQVERRTEKVRQTDVLPLCHATNLKWYQVVPSRRPKKRTVVSRWLVWEQRTGEEGERGADHRGARTTDKFLVDAAKIALCPAASA